jgi:serine/threonine protein kinase
MPGRTPPNKPSDELPTLRLGRYVLVRKLAEGGTASVHLGWDRDERAYRAIKTLLPEYAKRPALRQRFENEARTMQSLVHPNIVTVFDAGQEKDGAWLVMELCEGGSIVDWLEQHGRLPPRLACQVALDVCAGMAFAHQRGIIHRDIKPQNVLVSTDGPSKITDFGIAQVVEETRMTMTGTVMGTIGYMAPEQHESAKHADARADVYSLAATLYTLVAGEAPTHLFMANDVDFASIPAPLVEVIRKGSQYRREVRYESMEEMGAALTAALAQLPEDPPAPPLVRPGGMALPDFDSLSHSETDPVPLPTPLPDESSSNPTPPAAADPATTEEPSASSAARLTLVDDRRRLTPQEREAAARRRRIALGAAAVAALGVFALLLVAAVGSVRVQGFAALRDHAEEELCAHLHDERVILDDLQPLRLPEQDTIRALFEACSMEDREDRVAAMNRLVTTLDQVRRNLESGARSDEAHLVKQLRETVRRIQAHVLELRQREAKLQEVRSSVSGRVATLFGA